MRAIDNLERDEYIMSAEIACLGLAVIFGIIVFLFYRRKKLTDALQAFYQEGNYVQRQNLPISNPFIYEDMAFTAALDGKIRNDIPYTLILGTRFSGAGETRIRHDYIGFYFPPHESMTDEWLNQWKQKVAERGDNWAQYSGIEKTEKNWGIMGAPERLPIRAVRINNGILLAWNGLHLRHTIEARIQDVLDSLKG